MMNALRVYRRVSEKLKGFFARIKQVFRLPLGFRANTHSDMISVRKNIDDTGTVSQEASKKKNKRQKKEQRQIAVACTSKVQKRILKNLVAASVSRVSPKRAKVARELLIELEKTGSLANFQPKSNAARKDSHIEAAKPVLEVAKRLTRIKEFVPCERRKTNTGVATIIQRLRFRFGIGRVNQPVAS